MRGFTLSRRAVLRGLGSIAIGLPFLEAMEPKKASAAGYPKRFITFFSANGNFPQGTGDGTSFQLTPAFAPLEPHKDQLILLTGFDNQVAIDSPGDNHQKGIGTMLTGAMLSTEPIFCQALCDQGTDLYVGWATGPSIDQHLAHAPGIGDQTRFPSIELGVGVQIANVYARMSYAGARQPIPPEDDPLAAFSRLFGNASPELREKRRSVLDSVTADYAALDAKLGGADRRRVDAHLTAIREIENGLDKAPFVPNGTCQIPSYDRPADIYGDASYEAVGKAQMDLLVMALACDLTRVASLQWDTSVSNVLFSWIPGIVEGHHDLSHHSDGDAIAQSQLQSINRWYAERLAYLLAALRAVPEGEGTLLDNTTVLWSNELSIGNVHSLRDMHWLLAGSCGGAFSTGRLNRYAGDSHTNLLISIANAMGSPIHTFGDPRFCTGPMAGLAA